MKVYLDNSATTRPRKEILDMVFDYSYKHYGNPSSFHDMGFKVEKDINSCRHIIAESINSSDKEIYFTSGGTEANNIIIHGILNKYKNKDIHIICSQIEHPSVLNVFKNYQNNENIRVDYLKVDRNGKIDIEELKDKIKDNTVFISIMMVNNEIGSIQDIKKISNIINSKNKNIVFHSDCVQAFGKIDIDVRELGLDSISISAHKVHSLKGVGALYISDKIRINPMFQGGGQERNIRPGTENTPGIFGFEKAIKILNSNRNLERKKIKELKSYTIERLKEIEDICINSPIEKDYINNILNITIKEIKSEVLLHMLADEGIYISSGSACSSKSKTKSHVLNAIGFTDKEIDGSIRISFSFENEKEEIDYFIDKLKVSVKEIREIMRI